jgi:hypothetical protein
LVLITQEKGLEATFDLFEYVWESWWLGVRAGERQVDVGPSSKQLDLHAACKDQILTRGNTRTPERERERGDNLECRLFALSELAVCGGWDIALSLRSAAPMREGFVFAE